VLLRAQGPAGRADEFARKVRNSIVARASRRAYAADTPATILARRLRAKIAALGISDRVLRLSSESGDRGSAGDFEQHCVIRRRRGRKHRWRVSRPPVTVNILCPRTSPCPGSCRSRCRMAPAANAVGVAPWRTPLN